MAIKKDRSLFDNTVALTPRMPVKRRRRPNYSFRSASPLHSLWFTMIFLLAYELMVAFLGPALSSMSFEEIPGLVVSFVWVYELLGWFGFSGRLQWLLCPLFVVLVLLGVHFADKKRRAPMQRYDLPLMFAESFCWALPLLVIALIADRFSSSGGYVPADEPVSVFNCIKAFVCSAEMGESTNIFIELIAGIGAGIYEELFFRQILYVGLFLFTTRLLDLSREFGAFFAVVVSSVVFSLHHNILYVQGSYLPGEEFVASVFLFRVFAGFYLTVIFANRGFGIAAGAHCFHNILAVLFN
jgi:membrane protease YdiL (CAAX protease family)